MLIQNTSSAVPASGLASDSAPVPVAASETRSAPKVAVKAIPEQPVAQPTAAQVQGAVDSINKAMKQSGSSLEFSIDKDTNRNIIKVVESGTGDVIRQFPSEEALAISRAIDNMQQHGMLIKQKA